MNENEKLIHKFYDAFRRKDYRTMQELYHPQATFSDPAFGNLSSREVSAMWEMLINSSNDLKIYFGDIHTNEKTVTCHWEAKYTFTATGRKVHNRIDAEFEFKDGRIFKHRDSFNFWRWSAMALGTPGLLLGWTPVIKSKVRKAARERLDKFLAKQGH